MKFLVKIETARVEAETAHEAWEACVNYWKFPCKAEIYHNNVLLGVGVLDSPELSTFGHPNTDGHWSYRYYHKTWDVTTDEWLELLKKHRFDKKFNAILS